MTGRDGGNASRTPRKQTLRVRAHVQEDSRREGQRTGKVLATGEAGKRVFAVLREYSPVFPSAWGYCQTEVQNIYALWFETVFEEELGRGEEKEKNCQKVNPPAMGRGRPRRGDCPPAHRAHSPRSSRLSRKQPSRASESA